MHRSNTGPSPAKGALVLAACFLAALGEGIDLQAPGVTLPVLAPLFQLSGNEGGGVLAGFFSLKSLFLSMSTFGLFFGALIGGRLSDLFGRKGVLVASVFLFGLFSALTAHSTDARMLLWMRFFTGLGLGGCYANMIAITAENISPRWRNTAVGILYAGLPMGGALVSLTSRAWGTPEHWGHIYYLGALVPLAGMLGILLFVPNLKPLAHAIRKPSASHALWGEGRAPQTAVLWGLFVLALLIQYLLLSWLPTLLISKGLPRGDAQLTQVALNLCSVPGSIIAGMLIDRPSWRALGIVGVFGAGIVSLVILAVAPAQMPLTLAVVGFVGFAVAGTQAITYAMAPGVYPTPVRGTGVGFALAVGRLGAALGPLLAGAMLGAGLQPNQVLMVMAPLMVLAGLCALWLGRAGHRAAPALP
ncbi:MAG: MFS transporter [Comamonas sp.]